MPVCLYFIYLQWYSPAIDYHMANIQSDGLYYKHIKYGHAIYIVYFYLHQIGIYLPVLCKNEKKYQSAD